MAEKKTVDRLTPDSVSILTQKFTEVDGVEMQVGQNHRKAYVNSAAGRQDLQDTEPEEVVEAVFAMWGNEPTIAEPTEETVE
jgi:hypothetical protein